MRSGCLAEIRWSVCMSKSHWSLCVSFSWTDAGLCIYHLFIWYHYYYYYFTPLTVFYTNVSRWLAQVSRTLLSIAVDLCNTVVWIVSTCPLISESSSPFTNPLGIVPRAPITIGITVTFIFHNFFSSLARFRYLSLFSPFIFTLWSAKTAKSTI